MSGISTFIKAAAKGTAKTTLGWGKTLGGSAVNVLAHPVSTLTKASAAAVGGGAVFYGAQGVIDGKGAVPNIVDKVLGEENASNVREAASSVRETVSNVADGIGNGARNIADGIGSAGSAVAGALTSNGTESMGGLLSQLSSPNAGAMNILKLLAAAVLLFGRHGMLGKIAGAVLGISAMSSMIHQQPLQSPYVGMDAGESYEALRQASQNGYQNGPHIGH